MARLLFLHGAHRLADRPDRPHLNATNLRRRNARGDLDRFVEIARLDHVKAGEALLRFGERTVGHGHLAVAHAYGGRGGHRLQRFGGDAMAATPDFIVEGDAMAVVHRLQGGLFSVNETQIFHGVFSAMALTLDDVDRSAHFLPSPIFSKRLTSLLGAKSSSS